jgi:hypothetical protein
VRAIALGNISGTVTDAQGSVIPDAKVEVKNLGTNLVIYAETIPASLSGAQPATRYLPSISTGFERRIHVDSGADDASSVDTQLKVSQVTATVQSGTPLRNGPMRPLATCSIRRRFRTRRSAPAVSAACDFEPGVNADFLAGSGTAGRGSRTSGQRAARHQQQFLINAISATNLFNGKSSGRFRRAASR